MNAALVLVMMLAVSVVVLAVMAFLGRWVYRDARSKGLPAGMWTAIVLLVPGLMGLIIYLVYRSDKKATTVCINCAEAMDYSARFCPRCGYQAPPEVKMARVTRAPRKIIALIIIMSGVFFMGIIAVGLLMYSIPRSRVYSISEPVMTQVPYATAVSETYVVNEPSYYEYSYSGENGVVLNATTFSGTYEVEIVIPSNAANITYEMNYSGAECGITFWEFGGTYGGEFTFPRTFSEKTVNGDFVYEKVTGNIRDMRGYTVMVVLYCDIGEARDFYFNLSYGYE